MESGTAAAHTCPVCKSAITRDSLVPLYGRGKDKLADLSHQPSDSSSIPSRPAGHREEPPPQQQEPQYGAPGWTFQAGVGFPFPFFGVGFGGVNAFTQQGFPVLQPPLRQRRPAPRTAEQQQAELFSRILLVFGVIALLLVLLSPVQHVWLL